MSAAELLSLLVRENLALGAAIVVALVLRRPVRRWFGARAAYALWAIAPLAMIAAMAPGRIVHMPSVAAPAAAAVTQQAVVQAPPVAREAVRKTRSAPGMSLVLALWAGGVAATLTIQTVRQRRFMRSLGGLRPVDGMVFQAEHGGVGPAVIGAFSPRVVLPADFGQRFTETEQGLILAHERAHLTGGDAQINAVASIIQALFWCNPLVHIAVGRLRVDQEIACDAAVLARVPEARRAYGEAMLKTQLAPLALPVGCQWPATAHHHLKERFAMLPRHRHGGLRRAAGAAAVAALSLGFGYTVWAAQPARVVSTPVVKADTQDVQARGLGRALFEAVDDGNVAEARALLDRGADPNFRATGDGTPLIVAAREGRDELVDLLLAKGADPRLASRGDGDPMIMAAAHGRVGIVRTLAEHGASVEAFVPGDETPLINAARSGDLATVRYLVDQGADVNRAVLANPGEMRSPLGEAKKHRRAEVEAYLRARGARD